jgi:deoxyribonuclease-1
MRFILFAALFVLGSFQAQALTLSNETISYYGQDFYDRVHKGDRDADLLNDLKTVLTKKHQRGANGAMDQVVGQCSNASTCYEQNPIGYDAARKAVLGNLYLVKDGSGYGIKEVYCGRIYNDADFPDSKPGPGVVVADKIVNVEHTWAQSRFSNQFPKETQKSDLHHLFPSDSQLNTVRGTFWFGEVDHQKQALKCGQSKIGTWNGGGQFFEPPNAHKGNVARALMYFSVRYNMPIEASEEALLKKWNKADPVDDDDRTRNDAIEKLQGNRNPFIDFPELADSIGDF